MAAQNATMEKPKAQEATPTTTPPPAPTSTMKPTKAASRTVPATRPMAFSPMGWEPMRRMREELDRLLEQAFGGWPALMEAPIGNDRWGFDLQEKDDALIVRAEAPGFETGDFDVQIRGDHLILRATHEAEPDEKAGRHEWSRRELFRSVPLPSGIDASRVEADYRNGVLTVTLPKPAEIQARRIDVRG
ncbi:Hsp20/alpha crystallin family protein [Paludisphaera soli]|uniref:Hsp20/alpha crystallin family protein n=1 Tax=Paludisphaera soli TaxID=2712865 RepID=UPI0013EBFD14|nr:Hsp20/alpha crystallin family protein [Paludisphaera soli]